MSVIDHSPSAGTGAADPSPPRSWVPLLKRLHFYAGILIAPFLLVAAVTGGLYAVAPTVEKFVCADLLTTDSSGSPAPLADQVRAAQLRFPDLMVSAVRPPASAGDTTRVLFADPSLGESETRAVFIHPVSTDVVGESVSYGPCRCARGCRACTAICIGANRAGCTANWPRRGCGWWRSAG